MDGPGRLRWREGSEPLKASHALSGAHQSKTFPLQECSRPFQELRVDGREAGTAELRSQPVSPGSDRRVRGTGCCSGRPGAGHLTQQQREQDELGTVLNVGPAWEPRSRVRGCVAEAPGHLAWSPGKVCRGAVQTMTCEYVGV